MALSYRPVRSASPASVACYTVEIQQLTEHRTSTMKSDGLYITISLYTPLFLIKGTCNMVQAPSPLPLHVSSWP